MKNKMHSSNLFRERLCGIIIFIIIFSFIISCETTPQVGTSPIVLIANGWTNENTYHVIVIGNPKPGLEDKIQRRGTAREAALIHAQHVTLDCLANELSTANSSYSPSYAREIAKKRFGSLVTQGTISKETYNENDSCEIVYLITKKGLRNETSY